MKKKIARIASYILKEHKLITAIFLLGLFLRLLGTYPGYPLTHPDEPTIATPSIRMAFEGNFRPQNYYYGSLLSLIYATTYIIFFIPLSFIFTLPTTPSNYLNSGLLGFFDYLKAGPPLHQMSFWSASYWARYDSAIISSFTVLAAYLLGKKLFNKQIALIAALLIAVNYRHVLSSRLILADAPTALFALLAILFCVILMEKSSLKRYLLAGVGLGLALSVKYFVYVIPTFFLCHILAVKFKFNKLIPEFLHYKIFLSLIICAVVFILVNPYLLLASEEAAYFWAANSARYGLGLSIDILKSWNLSYYSLYYLFNYGLGSAISVLTISGFFWSLFRYPKSSLILTSVALPFIYVFLIISGTGMVRNYSAIIPFILFFPAVLIFNLSESFPKKLSRLKMVFLPTVLIIVSYQMLQYDLISGINLAKEQNMISLYKWLDSNLPEGSKILGPSGVFYPAGRNFEAVKINTNGNNFLSMEEIREQGTPWIIVSAMPAEITENLLLINDIAKKTFFDKNLIYELTSNFYSTLAFKELADYRVAQFAKSLTQDPPFMVAFFPYSWQLKKDTEVVRFGFDRSNEIAMWEKTFYPINSYENSQSADSLVIKQVTPQCKSLFTKISSPKINIEPNNWYTLSALAKRNANPIYKTTRSGFFRLDFYTKNQELVKTYITKPLSISSDWQKLYAAGMSQRDFNYVTITFQIDSCLENEEYLIDEVSLFSAKETPKIDKNKYPFYMKGTTLFDWLPQL